MSYEEREFGSQPGDPRELHRTFSVKVAGSKRRLLVTAEYYRVDDKTGALVFRNSVRGTYPETVQLFAPGYWLDLKVVER